VCRFSINLIPHTIAVTTLKHLHAGAKVNLEIDLIARYVERMLRLGIIVILDAARAPAEHAAMMRAGFVGVDGMAFGAALLPKPLPLGDLRFRLGAASDGQSQSEGRQQQCPCDAKHGVSSLSCYCLYAIAMQLDSILSDPVCWSCLKFSYWLAQQHLRTRECLQEDQMAGRPAGLLPDKSGLLRWGRRKSFKIAG
jgi:hypothetical protein